MGLASSLCECSAAGPGQFFRSRRRAGKRLGKNRAIAIAKVLQSIRRQRATGAAGGSGPIGAEAGQTLRLPNRGIPFQIIGRAFAKVSYIAYCAAGVFASPQAMRSGKLGLRLGTACQRSGTAKGFMLGAMPTSSRAWLQLSKNAPHAPAKPSAWQRTALRPTPSPGQPYSIGGVMHMRVQVRDYQTMERSTVLPCCSWRRGGVSSNMSRLLITAVPQRATTPRKSKNWGYFPAFRAQDANSLFGALWGRQPEKRLICRLFATARHFELWRAVV
jgi:hypothetical protein